MHHGMQAYVRDNASCSRDNMQRVLYIIDAFPRPQTAADGQNDALEQCTKVTLSAIKWAKRCVFHYVYTIVWLQHLLLTVLLCKLSGLQA